jgi:hypothetical protein
MRTRYLSRMAILGALLTLSSAASFAQNSARPDDTEQLSTDLDVALQRSTLSAEQRQKMRSEMRDLRAAHQNHQMIDGGKAASSLRAQLNSGAFRAQDEQRLTQEIDQIRESHGTKSGG